MMTIEQLILAVELLTLIVAGVSIGFVYWQIRQAKLALQLDNDRTRKQATIDFFLTNMRPVWREYAAKLKSRWGPGPLSDQALDDIKNDPQARDEVVALLDSLEIMSVGVALGIYDKETIHKVTGKYVLELYAKLKPYIDYKQGKTPETLNAFCRLAEDIAFMEKL